MMIHSTKEHPLVAIPRPGTMVIGDSPTSGWFTQRPVPEHHSHESSDSRNERDQYPFIPGLSGISLKQK